MSDATVTPRILPHSDDAEQAVLSAVFQDEGARSLDAIGALLEPGHFYRPRHQRIYTAMLELRATGAIVDPITVLDALARAAALEAAGGREYVFQLMDAVPTASHVTHHAKIVREKAERRALIAELEATAAALRAEGTPVREAAAALQSTLLPHAADVNAPGAKKGFVRVKDDLWEVMESIERRKNGEQQARMVPTGYPEIDDAIGGGFVRGEVVFIAGVPGGLKTAAALNIMSNAALDHAIGAAMISAEMSRHRVIERELARRARVHFGTLRKGNLRDDDFPRLAMAAGMLSSAPLWIDQTPRPTLRDVTAKARHLKSEHPELGLLVVDFVQLMQKGTTAREEENRSAELTDICYGLQALGKELEVVSLVTCQVDAQTVERRDDKRPKLADLRWSQAMREAGDFIALNYRPHTYLPDHEAQVTPDNLEMSFAKARDAEPFVATLNWIGQHMTLDSQKRRERQQRAEAALREQAMAARVAEAGL